jgi:hypothetical protein
LLPSSFLSLQDSFERIIRYGEFADQLLQTLILRLELSLPSFSSGSGERLLSSFNELLFPRVEYDWVHSIFSAQFSYAYAGVQ